VVAQPLENPSEIEHGKCPCVSGLQISINQPNGLNPALFGAKVPAFKGVENSHYFFTALGANSRQISYLEFYPGSSGDLVVFAGSHYF
jgi:hypothetical protein